MYCPVVGFSFKYGSERSGTIKDMNFLHQLAEYQNLKKGSAPRSDFHEWSEKMVAIETRVLWRLFEPDRRTKKKKVHIKSRKESHQKLFFSPYVIWRIILRQNG
jgi:hypothetical protein